MMVDAYHTKPPPPGRRGAGPALTFVPWAPPQSPVCSRNASELGVRNARRRGWSWEAAVESSC